MVICILGANVRRMIKAFNSARFLGLIDQAAISAFNFLAVIFAGRSFSQSDFGVFALLWMATPIVTAMLAGLWAVPVSIVYPSATDSMRARINAFAFVAMYAVFVLGAIGFVLALVAWLYQFEILFWIGSGIALVCWRTPQEISRRLLLAMSRPKRAILVTTLSTFAPIVAIGILALIDGIALRETILTGLVGFALSSAPLLLWHRAPLPGWDGIVSVYRRIWPYGRPLTIAAAVDTVSIRLLPYFLMVFHTAANVGSWAAAATLLGPLRVVLVGMGATVTVLARKGAVAGGKKGAAHECLRTGAWLTAFLSPILVLLWLFPAEAMEFVFDAKYSDASEILTLYLFSYPLMALNMLLAAYLAALGYVGQRPIVSIATLTLGLVGIPLLVPSLGTVALPYLAIAYQVLALMINLWWLLRLKYSIGSVDHDFDNKLVEKRK